MEKADELVVDGHWLQSWWEWPGSWVDGEVRVGAARWFVEHLTCSCTRPGLERLPSEELPGLVGLFAGRIRDGVSRSFLMPGGSRAFMMLQHCQRTGLCPERKLVRVVMKW